MEIDRDQQPASSQAEPDHGKTSDDAAERRGGYLGFVAHEVRNPLSTALWSAELLVRMSPAERGGTRGDKLSAMCLRSLSRVRQLVEDHFLCERLDVGGIPVRPENLSVRELLEAVVERRGPDAPPVEIGADVAASVSVDRMLAERALDSLIAVAAGDRGPAQVSASERDDHVLVAIVGPGAAEHTFDDPRKGSPSDPRGRALALAVARRVARALDGTLSAIDGGYVLAVPRAQPAGAEPHRT
jgi:K+-sensing histidine kinase KdpD